MIELRVSIFIALIIMVLMLSGEVIYQGVTIDIQKHTIRQLFDLEPGPDDTPRPPKMPAYVPPADLRST